MSKTILFRAKRQDNKQWVYGFYVYQFEIGYHSQSYTDVPPRVSYIVDDKGGFYEIHYNTLCQYTGINDRTGERVFERDIFKAPHDFGPGGFEERQGVVRFDKDNGYQWNYWSVDQLQVIGNEIDNPELLEGVSSGE